MVQRSFVGSSAKVLLGLVISDYLFGCLGYGSGVSVLVGCDSKEFFVGFFVFLESASEISNVVGNLSFYFNVLQIVFIDYFIVVGFIGLGVVLRVFWVSYFLTVCFDEGSLVADVIIILQIYGVDCCVVLRPKFFEIIVGHNSLGYPRLIPIDSG